MWPEEDWEFEGAIDDDEPEYGDDEPEDEGDEEEEEEPEGEEPEGDEPDPKADGKAKDDKPKADDKAKDDKPEEEVASAWAVRAAMIDAVLGPAPKRDAFKNDASYTNALMARHEGTAWVQGVSDALTKPMVYKGVTVPPLPASDVKRAVEEAASILQKITPEKMSLLLRLDSALRSAKAEGSKVIDPKAAAPQRPKAERPSSGGASNKDRGNKRGGTANKRGGTANVNANDHAARALAMFGPTAFKNPFDPR